MRLAGWAGPVVSDVRIEPGATFHIDPSNLRLDETIDGLNAQGVRVDSAVPGDTPVVLLLAEQQDGPTYRVGFNNFHALTRYNHSALYAMAVDELARAITLRLTQPTPDHARGHAHGEIGRRCGSHQAIRSVSAARECTSSG